MTTDQSVGNTRASSTGRIVVGVDDSEAARAALRWGLVAARARGGRVAAVAVSRDPIAYAPLGWSGITLDEGEVLASADAILDRVLGSMSPELSAGVDIERVTRVGSAAEVLTEQAADADIVVVGTRGLHGLFRWLGSVSDQVVRSSPTTVVVVPDPAGVAASPDGPIVVGIDGSPNSEAALRWAAVQGHAQSLPVRAVTVWSLFDRHHLDGGKSFDPDYGNDAARTALAELVGRVLGPDQARDIELDVVCDLPAAGLLSAAEAAQASLVVAGSRGLGGFRGMLLGSVSHQLLVGSSRPVAIVRSA